MIVPGGSSTQLHPIQIVSRRTGLSQDLIRAWEKRYRAVEPSRTPTRRRLYTDADVDRLLLLKRATLAGRSIGEVARLDDSALAALVREDEAATAPPVEPARAMETESELAHLEACRRAVELADPERLRARLGAAVVELGRPALFERVIVPLMEAIGTGWENGTLKIHQEHMATALVRALLDSLLHADPPSLSAPLIVVATPVGQMHELGAMVAGAVASSIGWRVAYLGCDLPSEEIADCAIRSAAHAVALSVSYSASDPTVAKEIRSLNKLLPRGVALIVGGRAAQSYAQEIREVGGLSVTRIDSLRSELSRMERQS